MSIFSNVLVLDVSAGTGAALVQAVVTIIGWALCLIMVTALTMYLADSRVSARQLSLASILSGTKGSPAIVGIRAFITWEVHRTPIHLFLLVTALMLAAVPLLQTVAQLGVGTVTRLRQIDRNDGSVFLSNGYGSSSLFDPRTDNGTAVAPTSCRANSTDHSCDYQFFDELSNPWQWDHPLSGFTYRALKRQVFPGEDNFIARPLSLRRILKDEDGTIIDGLLKLPDAEGVISIPALETREGSQTNITEAIYGAPTTVVRPTYSCVDTHIVGMTFYDGTGIRIQTRPGEGFVRHAQPTGDPAVIQILEDVRTALHTIISNSSNHKNPGFAYKDVIFINTTITPLNAIDMDSPFLNSPLNDSAPMNRARVECDNRIQKLLTGAERAAPIRDPICVLNTFTFELLTDGLVFPAYKTVLCAPGIEVGRAKPKLTCADPRCQKYRKIHLDYIPTRLERDDFPFNSSYYIYYRNTTIVEDSKGKALNYYGNLAPAEDWLEFGALVAQAPWHVWKLLHRRQALKYDASIIEMDSRMPITALLNLTTSVIELDTFSTAIRNAWADGFLMNLRGTNANSSTIGTCASCITAVESRIEFSYDLRYGAALILLLLLAIVLAAYAYATHVPSSNPSTVSANPKTRSRYRKAVRLQRKLDVGRYITSNDWHAPSYDKSWTKWAEAEGRISELDLADNASHMPAHSTPHDQGAPWVPAGTHVHDSNDPKVDEP
ncbi:uncharacterized protein EV422DRAFT_414076 [Fimicolochytrium jonesii]|uniref:uncharacterized protein n=1 Tax=Fimicolochytrium jonesii TaxID=1396493 RepID=UPI0022FF3882|nr:uncharacterized protein EV422DRAFT_414076 [Fimicolochytrium jonesii]KAI8822028.1 hypothetical protein EV422DRAFT_414076 [Fimicolochytrium jonesii]